MSPADRPIAGPTRRTPMLGKLVRLGVAAAVAGLLGAGVAHWAGARVWPLELLHHFVPQYACAGAVLALLALALRQPWVATVACVLAAAFAAEYWRSPLPGPAAIAPEPPSLTLVTNNVFVDNPIPDELVAWLATRPAAVVVLQEVNARLAERLRRGEDGYPHRLIAEEDYFGPAGDRDLEASAVLSIWPIVADRAPGPWAARWQGTIARIDMGDVRPWLVVVHPPSPMWRRWIPVRDRFYTELPGVIRALDGPVIVAGDFNATPWSPIWRDFVRATGLHSFTRYPATYSSGLGPFGLPIDHVLVRGGILEDLHALPSIGSDHRALRAEIAFPAGAH